MNRKEFWYLFTIVFATAILSACSKENPSKQSVVTTKPDTTNSGGNKPDTIYDGKPTNDTVNIILNGLLPATCGMLAQVNSGVNARNTATFPGTGVKDSTVVEASVQNILPIFSYTSNWEYSFVRVNTPTNTVLTWTYNFVGAGNYDDNVSYSSSFIDTGKFTITDGIYIDTLIFNIKYNRSEKLAPLSKASTLSDQLGFQTSNLVVNKQTGEVISGTCSVNLALTSGQSQTFSLSGSVTFQGNRKGVLVLNKGATYYFKW